jgi:hypothetical protein
MYAPAGPDNTLCRIWATVALTAGGLTHGVRLVAERADDRELREILLAGRINHVTT